MNDGFDMGVIVVLVIAAVFVLPFGVQLVWNWAELPAVFGGEEIGYKQAFGITVVLGALAR